MPKNESHVQIIVNTVIIIEHLLYALTSIVTYELSHILDLVVFCGMNVT